MRLRVVIGRLGDRRRDRRVQRAQFGAIERLLVVALRRRSAASAAPPPPPCRPLPPPPAPFSLVLTSSRYAFCRLRRYASIFTVRAVEFLPDALANGGEQFGRGIRRGAIERLLFDQAREALIVQQRGSARCSARCECASSTPIGSMRRRISGSISHSGVAKALSTRNFTASSCRNLGNQREDAAFLADHLFLAVESADDLRHVIHFGLPLAQHAAVELARDPRRSRLLSTRSPDISILATRCRFFMPIAVDFTASASPTASVSSPGSEPAEFGGREAKPRGVVLLARPFVERRLLVVAASFAPGIGV